MKLLVTYKLILIKIQKLNYRLNFKNQPRLSTVSKCRKLVTIDLLAENEAMSPIVIILLHEFRSF